MTYHHSIHDTLDCAVWEDDQPRPVLRAVPPLVIDPLPVPIPAPVRVIVADVVLAIIDETAPALCTHAELLARVMRRTGAQKGPVGKAVREHARARRISYVQQRGVWYWQRCPQS